MREGRFWDIRRDRYPYVTIGREKAKGINTLPNAQCPMPNAQCPIPKKALLCLTADR
ncbi:MAG: hypothetical protein F6J93_22125 [Oscillatoria sp. SIO1A7]|nr:hypothetical protein [Oscillatoria sp. SIO1A7]